MVGLALAMFVALFACGDQYFGWEDPVNLGPFVNTSADEGSPSVTTGDGAHAGLYFSRGLTIFSLTGVNSDIIYFTLPSSTIPVSCV